MNISDLDQWFPPAGPCFVCGFHDKRHRLWDAIIDHMESDHDVAEAHGLPEEAVRAVRSVMPYQDQVHADPDCGYAE